MIEISIVEIGVIKANHKDVRHVDKSEIEAYSGELRPCVAVVVMAGLSGGSTVATGGPVPLEVRGIDVPALGLPSPWLDRR